MGNSKKPLTPRTQMRHAVEVPGTHGRPSGHFYVKPKSIEVYARDDRGGVGSCRITRQQLEAALALMDRV